MFIDLLRKEDDLLDDHIGETGSPYSQAFQKIAEQVEATVLSDPTTIAKLSALTNLFY